MQSPMKHAKKTRKNTFSQVAVVQSEVGDFQGGYFVMPDATSSKENDCPHKTRAPNNSRNTIERSPARRKHNNSDPTSSPNKERNYYDTNKKPAAEMSLSDVKKENSFRNELTTMASPKKSAPASPKHQHTDLYDQKYYSSSPKDVLSTSPSSSSGRWAGPAFGNAPHPSSLPLPVWNSSSASPFPTSSPAAAASAPSHFMTSADSHPSKSPPAHDGAASFLGGMVYHHHPVHPFPSPSPPPSFSSIPVVPFPYVSQPSQMPPPSLAQLSTDLRRMLNIAGPVPVNGPFMSDLIVNSA